MKIGDCLFGNDPTKPGLGSATVTYSDDTDIWEGEVARELIVFSAGAVCFVGLDGEDDTWTFTSDMAFPQRIRVFIKRVKNTGTTVDAGNIHAVR